MLRLLVSLVMIASLGVAVADEVEWEDVDVENNPVVPFDSEAQSLELKSNFEEDLSNPPNFGVKFVNDDGEFKWFVLFRRSSTPMQWNCGTDEIDVSEEMAAKVLGPVTWSFTIKDNKMIILANGEEWLEITASDCDKLGEEFKSVKFYKDELTTLPQQYRIVAQKDEDNTDEDNTDEDEKKNYSGSSQIYLNGLVMISTLLARLHL